MRSSGNIVLGLIIIILGLNILFDQLYIDINLGLLIWPIIAFSLAYHFYKKGRKWLMWLFTALAVISISNEIFHFDLTGFIIAAVFLYFGLKLMKRNDTAKEIDIDKDLPSINEEENSNTSSPYTVDQTPDLAPFITNREEIKYKSTSEAEESVKNRHANKTKVSQADKRKEPIVTPSYKNMFIGDYKLMKRRFALQDMNVKYGIGDISIDFSKAIIDEGETVIVLHGGIGDVDLYVPYELDISVQASATIGDMNILGQREEGLNKQLTINTDYYKEADRKIKVIISVIIGDIDVRYV
ncbi:cell wall-active antibiotics response protein LiaF [Alteribacillus bidgolensis]|uniref:Lia operon protein LiaF n=1 Tax=Alteribacillus bidgolensis TaxID=930129 RepID=A0A1G8N531_9BACI|nr:cell wall-active antibiotics response protein LiaF [Alteribacillus bidgolensis]SDI75167.1 lia operon protein LiaF [Alteribacillus bidgolensis]